MKAFFSPLRTALVSPLRRNGRGLLPIIYIGLLLCIASCKKENSPQQQYPIPSNLQLVSSGYAAGAATRVEIYAAGNLFVGYNKVYIAIYDSVSNNRITQAQISLSAVITTGSTITQSCPVENPTANNANNGLFNAAVIFVAPSATAGNWVLSVNVQNVTNAATGNFAATVNVVQASPAKAYSVITKDNGTSLFVSLIQPFNPQVGSNNYEVAIYRQISPVNYVPDSTYMVNINPQMPSMEDMSAPNNVNPAYTGSGHYLGKVDFIMSGGWQVNTNLVNNTVIADTSHYFDINLQ